MPTLVVGPNWVGDMILAHSLIAYIKSKRASDPLHVLAPAWSLHVAQRMAEVDQVIELPFGHGELHLKRRWQFARQLKYSKYHRSFVLPNSWKSALIPWMAGIPRRIGWRGEHRYKLLTDHRLLHPERFPRMVDRYLALAFPANLALSANQLPEAPEFPVLTVDEARQTQLLSEWSLDRSRLIALCPGAEFGAAKQWPLERYALLAERLAGQGHQVVLMGSDNDRQDTEAIVEAVASQHHEAVINLAGQTTLLDAIDLIGAAQGVVTNDSGLMHVAAATGRPLVALFGPSSPSHTPPLSDNASIVTHPIPCHPCFERTCPLHHQACLSEVTVDQVMDALEVRLRAIV
jgi:heptosyltransferase-2